MPRKPAPTTIYREEVYHPVSGSAGSTRQTFDHKQYESWRAYAATYGGPDYQAVFTKGVIEWEPDPLPG